ncbi:hybrid sensor histidine kinase/response regulator [Leptospira kanakyensis]|uniref:histidine kinase n=1 Tax=Leptospira kanakyensis TaxID=2484968 RepID=A0A6N4PZJ3_9LEPT|nr:response regulator [Leptospira kanakyensis]MCW7469219.1 response regulator [Leptospira kanakyensis]MCW7480208.1 response regulator [Leptospira kanakyensis]TGK50411.1 response regulator [Leptospira kanakyensis]TGK63987.1 response regulator [Leptospira kanakyensis]TGK69549.1 response regulator [Leptospira kanakyensis]
MDKILIIDDEEDIRIALKRVLSREGYQIELSESAAEAIQRISAGETFSVVISDILMSGMSGIDFTKFIAEKQINLPVILITGNPNLSSAESAIRYHAFEYISKPVDKTQILSVVKRAIEVKNQKDSDLEKLMLSEKLEKALRTQNLDLNRQNAAILNATSDAVITIDSKLTVVSANKSSFDMFRFLTPLDLIGQSVKILFTENKMQKYMSQVSKVLSEEVNKSTLQLSDVTLLRSDYTTFLADIAICSYNLDGDRYYTGVIRDVTQKKQMVEQLIHSERRAFLSVVAASIGHEINNSLTAIQGFVEMASRENADIMLKDRALKVTLNQTEKLRALTSNLLQLGKSLKSNNEKSKVLDLNKEITSVLQVFKETAKLKYCHIKREESENEIPIRMNSDQFALLLSNILLNAADATNNIGTIEIISYLDTKNAHLIITDDGEGMSTETLDKIYEPYFTTKELGKGTGLGMFVVKQIVDNFEIQLEIESTTGKGSKFHFIFPKVSER